MLRIIKRTIFDCLVNDFTWDHIPAKVKKNRHLTFCRGDLLLRHDKYKIKLYFQDLTVKAGVFKGLKYFQSKAFASAFYPKLVGTYEIEIQSSLKKLLKQTNYENIIDIGCAEGYYLGGIGLICKNAHLYGIDISEEALDLTERLLLYNDIEKTRFSLSKKLNLSTINTSNKNLVIIDCEGHELEFIKNFDAKYLSNCDFLIECHDCFIPLITSQITELLESTHFLEIISSTGDELKIKNIPEDLLLNSYYEKFRLVNEERGAIMNWVVARSKLF
jgi:SAM-dependent methyltransferase